MLPYLLWSREDSAHQRYELRVVFSAVRYVVMTGVHRRFLPHDLPPCMCGVSAVQRVDAGRLLRSDCGGSSRPLARVLRPQGEALGDGGRQLDTAVDPKERSTDRYDDAKRRKGFESARCG